MKEKVHLYNPFHSHSFTQLVMQDKKKQNYSCNRIKVRKRSLKVNKFKILTFKITTLIFYAFKSFMNNVKFPFVFKIRLILCYQY